MTDDALTSNSNWALDQVESLLNGTNRHLSDENGHIFAAADQITLAILALAYEVRTSNLISINGTDQSRDGFSGYKTRFPVRDRVKSTKDTQPEEV